MSCVLSPLPLDMVGCGCACARQNTVAPGMMLSADEADATDPDISYNQKSPGETPRLFVENDGRGEELPLGRLGFDVDIGKAATCPRFADLER